jgi:hypothetical protein
MATAQDPTAPKKAYTMLQPGDAGYDPNMPKNSDQVPMSGWDVNAPAVTPEQLSSAQYAAIDAMHPGGLTSTPPDQYQSNGQLPPVNTAASPGAPAHGAAGAMPSGPITNDTPLPGTGNSPSLEDLVKKQLANQINPAAIDPAALQTSPEAQAERLTSQRAADQQRAQIAEQNAQSGLAGTGGGAGLLRGVDQAQAERDTQFIGQLAATKVAQQLDQIKFGIQAAMQAGQFDKAQALQLQLAQLQDAAQRYGIDTAAKTAQGAQAVQMAGINTAAQTAAGEQDVQRYGIDTGAKTAAGNLGLGYAQLGQAGEQFGDTLGYNYAALTTKANQDALLALLGGGGAGTG